MLVSVILLLFLFISPIGSALAQDGSPVPDILDAPADASSPSTAFTDQLIVKYRDAYNSPEPASQAFQLQLEKLEKTIGVELTFVRVMTDNAQVLKLPQRMEVAEISAMIDQLVQLPEIAYVEPDLILQHTLTPNDTYYTNQWHYQPVGPNNYGIDAPAAWNLTTGSQSVVVAVIDTGITNHSEFTGRTVPGYDFITDVLTANDQNGRDSDPSDPGDWITAAESASGFFEGCEVSESSWHGTHTAGTIGAASNNGAGVAGVNWNSKLLPVRVLGKCGGYTSDIIDGMRWSAGLSVSGVTANANPAKVINLSLGGPGACGTTMQNAVNAIRTAGTTIVVSAGNSNADAANFNPANCSGVITVAATNRLGSRAYYSNYGSTIELSAPGGDSNGYILSTLNSGTQGPAAEDYASYQGTSMAAPHVSGVASLLYSIQPSLTPDQILTILQNSSFAFPAGSNCTSATCGSGIVNAGLAVLSISPPPSAFNKSSPTNGAVDQSRNPTLSWGTSANATSYQYCIDTTNDGACSTWVDTGSATSVALIGLSASTTYYWQVRAVNMIALTYANGAENSHWSFTTAAPSAPAMFNKVLPANAATGQPTVFSLSWNSSAGADAYEYCYDTEDDDACSEWINNGTATSAAINGLTADATYYWQVKATNGQGSTFANDGTWWSFTTAGIYPAMDQKLATKYVTFNWPDEPGATRYKIQLSLDPNFSTLVLKTKSLTSDYAYTTALLKAKTYYWRIKPGDAASWGDWSPTYQFFSMNPPTAPALTAPAANLKTNNPFPEFSWQAATRGVSYQIQLSRSEFFTPLELDKTLEPGVLTFVPDSALSDGRYYWRVRAYDEVGAKGPWSIVRSVKVDTTPPAAPVLASPSNNAANKTKTPTFKWYAVTGAKVYEFQYDNDIAFTEPVAYTSPITSLLEHKPPASMGLGTYYWRVRARDAAGNWGAWSSPRTLTIVSIANGNFENGAKYWAEYSSNGWQLITTDLLVPAHSGSYAAWMGGDINEVSRLTQSNVNLIGARYLHYWYWIGSEDYCGYDFAKVIVNSATVKTYQLCTSTKTNGWAHDVIDLAAYAGTMVTLQFQATTDFAYNSNFFLDDVMITNSSTTPPFTASFDPEELLLNNSAMTTKSAFGGLLRNNAEITDSDLSTRLEQ
jgi:subtilisin family serine protease